jgi:hypothetical protein
VLEKRPPVEGLLNNELVVLGPNGLGCENAVACPSEGVVDGNERDGWVLLNILEPNGETVPWPTVELNKDGVEPKLGVLVDPKRDGDEPAEKAGVVDD